MVKINPDQLKKIISEVAPVEVAGANKRDAQHFEDCVAGACRELSRDKPAELGR